MTEASTAIPLSVLIRTKNEADRLGATLDSVRPLGAEVVVIDAGSTDRTKAIAAAYGARIFENPWPGFGPQRHFGEDKCTHDFIFSLDADEVLTPEIIKEIRALFATNDTPKLMVIRKAAVFPKRRRPPPWSFHHEQILLYDRRVARTGPNPNWDKLEISTDAKPITVQAPLWHFSLRDLNHAVSKAVFVGQLAADTQPVRPAWRLALRLPFEFPLAFLKYYFVRRYFLAGIDGLVYGVVGAFSRFIRVALMWERSKYGPRGRGESK